jgi:hypothetical protein
MVSIAPYSIGEVVGAVVLMWALLVKTLIVLAMRYVKRRDLVSIACAAVSVILVVGVQATDARIGTVFFVCGGLVAVTATLLMIEGEKWLRG